MSVFDQFERKHDYLVCVDSDGCAMDTMNSKHMHCFGPCMVTEWALEPWEEQILRRWNDINLFQMTRGINRFKALAIALGEISDKYTPILGVDALRDWVAHAPALSNDGIAEAIDQTEDEDGKLCLRKALNWSIAVNETITRLPEDLKQPFRGAKAALMAAASFADVVVVSSANRDAVEEEWGKYGLEEHVSLLLSQDCGSESHCISRMLEFGYEKDHVLMVGDAPGDCDAAEKNGVWYYPILVNHEKASWDEAIATAFGKLQAGEYAEYEVLKKKEFLANLGG